VVPVVEGHGEVRALPILLRRIGQRIDPERFIDVRQPIRGHRSKLTRRSEAERFLQLAVQKLGHEKGSVLVLIDADDDCAATLGPELVQVCQDLRPGLPVSVVLAVMEYEAWFLAAAQSLRGCRGLPDDLDPPDSPESFRDAKGWIQSRRIDGLAYGETTDQPALTAIFDLDQARATSASFDKLWRDVERLMTDTSG
jgi:hypothetical protein